MMWSNLDATVGKGDSNRGNSSDLVEGRMTALAMVRICVKAA